MERLEADGAALWLARIGDDDAAALARAQAALTAPEQARAARLRTPQARAQFVAGRAVLRAALTRHGGGAPADWRFRADALGRLRLDAADQPFVFSLSHMPGLVACALARQGEIGVDVEAIDAPGDLLAMARVAFGAPEVAALARLDGAARREAFLATWTLKEAYVKARGLGPALDPTRFAISPQPPIRLVPLDGGDGDDPGRWRFLRLSPTPQARVALAAAAPLRLDGLAPRWIALDACFS